MWAEVAVSWISLLLAGRASWGGVQDVSSETKDSVTPKKLHTGSEIRKTASVIRKPWMRMRDKHMCVYHSLRGL